jgi:hypothetical protein
MRSKILKIASLPWIADLISLFGGAFYLFLLWKYTHTRESVLDEGAYLYKGYLFATGQYTIYQDYGPWSNHMPLSFLIPGYIQRLFGPGLDIGRYFAVLVAFLILVGLWILVRRLKGSWWAAGVVWVFIWNPVTTKTYSAALSQGLIACMLVWTLALVLGEGRSRWQIILGGVLSGIMVMTRVNMLPLLPLLALYVAWERNIRDGVLVGLVIGITLIIVHALFWPGILQLWAYWLPRGLTPFLNDFRLPAGYMRLWNPQVSLESRVLSFLYGYRLHFAAMSGIVVSTLLWPGLSRWKRQSDFRVYAFLLALFLSLLLFHMWAALGNNYCVFCLPGYMAFFSFLGLLVVPISFYAWKQRLGWRRQTILILLILALTTAIGYAAFEKIGAPLLDVHLPSVLSTFPRISTGSQPLSKILLNRFNLKFGEQRRLASAGAGFLAGGLILTIAALLRVILPRIQNLKRSSPADGLPSYAYWALLLFLVSGIVFTPTLPLGGGKNAFDCGGNTIASYQAAGEHLAKVIPPGSHVYWMGEESAVPLLYVPGIHIYPPQLNGDYSFYLNGDSDTLLKFGFWNEELNQKWLYEADFILVQDRFFDRWKDRATSIPPLEELAPSSPTAPCVSGGQIHIFKRAAPSIP